MPKPSRFDRRDRLLVVSSAPDRLSCSDWRGSRELRWFSTSSFINILVMPNHGVVRSFGRALRPWIGPTTITAGKSPYLPTGANRPVLKFDLNGLFKRMLTGMFSWL